MAVTAKPIAARQYGDLQVLIFDTGADLGAWAAANLAQTIAVSIAARGYASIIVATGNSQLQFMRALRERNDIQWNQVYVFHMDEYPDLSAQHPASFRRYIRQNLTDVVRPRAFFGIEADALDVDAELRRYTDLLKQYPPDVTVMGIGENGHLAFNDPPADFHTERTIQWVTLDEACRRQQLGEGHFPTLDDVPKRALSLTIPALLSSREVLVVVPERRKAPAVKEALEGPVTPHCPASILQRQQHARLYLDRDSASLLT
jgi:glucosamine-6-phosphate deaminase